MTFDVELFSKLIENKKYTNQDLVDILKNKYGIEITIDTMKSYRRKNGKNATPTLDKLIAFSDILNTSIDALSGKKVEAKVKAIPIISTASCGSVELNCLQDEKMQTFISENEWNKDLYAVVACGDSMATEIYDGDIAIIDPFAKVQNGDMVYYKIDDESAIKVFFEDDDNYLINFIPFNTNENFKIKTIRKDDKETNDKLVYHKVVHVVSSKKNNRAARLKIIGR
ncbi:S24 family peptidase [Aliarcobacter skirrowii]|uniref:S24 family peptidase n=1 Tax=Aliarcobacter skirrowii TaxID=28200 RepID=UPI0029A9B2F0|nr:S24 family peptidase [Aliarcobacter skirrowii]MDX4061698.1 S24 family peptidase [Aliarcobacter skirrowii]